MFHDLLHQIPFEIHIVAAVVLAAGVVIWAFGHRLLRPGLVLAGMVVGAAFGFVATGFINEAAPAWIVVLIAAGVFGVISIAAYRFVMSALLAGCLAVALPLGFYAYTEISGRYEGQPGEPISAEELRLPLGESGAEDGTLNGDESFEEKTRDLALEKAKEELRKQWEQLAQDLKRMMPNGGGGDDDDTTIDIASLDENAGDETTLSEDSTNDSEWRTHWRSTIDLIASTVKIRWQDAPAGQKWGMVLCAVAGAIGGFLAGMLVPGVSAAIVTATTGAAFILTGVLWLGTRIGIPQDWLQPSSATFVLIVWILVAALGILVQFKLKGRKKADNT